MNIFFDLLASWIVGGARFPAQQGRAEWWEVIYKRGSASKVLSLP